MDDDGVEGAAVDAVAALTAAVDALLAVPVAFLREMELLELTRLVEVQGLRLPAFDHVDRPRPRTPTQHPPPYRRLLHRLPSDAA